MKRRFLFSTFDYIHRMRKYFKKPNQNQCEPCLLGRPSSQCLGCQGWCLRGSQRAARSAQAAAPAAGGAYPQSLGPRSLGRSFQVPTGLGRPGGLVRILWKQTFECGLSKVYISFSFIRDFWGRGEGQGDTWRHIFLLEHVWPIFLQLHFRKIENLK